MAVLRWLRHAIRQSPMGEGTEEQAFTVTDRRGHRSEPAAPSSPATPRTEASQAEASASAPFGFSDFILSLATGAMFYLGEPTPQGQAGTLDLPRARETIDLLSLLEEKTRGNLTPEESSVLSNLLYSLRLRYVEKAR